MDALSKTGRRFGQLGQRQTIITQSTERSIVARRGMSVDPNMSEAERDAHAAAKGDQFWTISRYGTAAVGFIFLWKILLFPSHETRPEGHYKYMHRRVKAYPWGDGDTNLFGNPERLQHHDDGHKKSHH